MAAWSGLSTKVVDRFSLNTKRSEEGEDKVVSYYHKYLPLKGVTTPITQAGPSKVQTAVTEIINGSTFLPSKNPAD